MSYIFDIHGYICLLLCTQFAKLIKLLIIIQTCHDVVIFVSEH